MEIWHNPRCGKSRTAKAALDAADPSHTVRRYLDEPPSAAELDEVLTKLDRQPWEITRLKEPVAKELGLADKPKDRAAWIAVLVANPVLIERPIIVTDDGRAYLARTPEALDEALS
ncbi:arsenate reductase family protein [Actinokineospora globicatena]|uniref:arsenate reductase family protein n=1 Tax=Actinokineospora globicatena TaxID=103729 RepID=UPI0020A5DBAF|nr:arsenate reductase family protein [Actinokineospora globicatena]MCP2300410.1 arsenate reductase [Actinokineospora globicatena]GLW80943.1 arsenate reductase [Actinokineospora globicatena]GLW88136.1 arsenate reductase [Actinokineospora globicatena]